MVRTSVTDQRQAIERAFTAAVRASDPRRAVRDQFVLEPDDRIRLAGVALEVSRSIEAIAVGKAAAGMMLGAVDALGDRLRRGFVLTKDGQTSAELPGSFRQAVASHPVLDERSLRATSELIAWLAESPRDGIALCLISGGGSALLELPVDGVSLADFQHVTRLLLHAGADIHQLNAVRSQISRVKGGRLRDMIPAEVVVNLIVSDVLGNDVPVIASGPTVKPVSTPDDALVVLDQLGLADRMPGSVRGILNSDHRPQWPERTRDRTVIVADNVQALAAADMSLRTDGYRVKRSSLPGAGEASVRAREWVHWLAGLQPDATAAIAGGEYTVEVTGDGLGGRNTEFALAAAIELNRLGIREWTVASLATDGDDALTGVAGAIVDGASVGQMIESGSDPAKALESNDSSAPLAAIGATHAPGPTGTNVNDLYLAVRA